jgi:putative membrane protein
MKCTVFGAGILGFTMLLSSCGNNNTGTGSTDTTATKTDTAMTSQNTQPQAMKSPEQDFVNYAVPANTTEMVWLREGISKSDNKEIKNHAKMMLKDHEKLDDKVKAYLSTKGTSLTVPTVDTSNAVNINDKKGKDWDKAWVDKMVEDHSGLLDKLKTSQKDVKDSSLLTLINSTIPTVESHLAMAKSMQSKM